MHLLTISENFEFCLLNQSSTMSLSILCRTERFLSEAIAKTLADVYTFKGDLISLCHFTSDYLKILRKFRFHSNSITTTSIVFCSSSYYSTLSVAMSVSLPSPLFFNECNHHRRGKILTRKKKIRETTPGSRRCSQLKYQLALWLFVWSGIP